MDGIINHLSLCLSTPRDIFDTMNDQQKDVVNMIKTFVNRRPCAFFWHNGHADSGCELNGLHIHMVVESQYPVYQQHLYKAMKRVLTKYGIQVKSQKVRHLEALLHHLQKPPGITLSCNNLNLCARLKKTRKDNPFYAGLDMPDFQQGDGEVVQQTSDGGNFMNDMLQWKREPPAPSMTNTIDEMARMKDMDNLEAPSAFHVVKKPLSMTKPAENVDRLKTLMRKYNKFTDEDLLKEIMKEGNPTDILDMRVMNTMHYFDEVLRQAVTGIRLEDELNGLTYIDKFVQECPSLPAVLTVEETAQLHLQWCKDQGIDAGDMLMKMYCILGKVFPKRNCLMLQGQSNAGKTYWTVPLMPFADCVGQTIPSQDFAFQKCINKDLIQNTRDDTQQTRTS